MTAFGLLYRSLHNPQNGSDLALIRALRKLTASYITTNAHNATANHGISFHDVCVCAGEFEGVLDFCNKIVLPDGMEAETICQQALPAALGVGVRIALLDRTSAKDITFHDFGLVAEIDPEHVERPLVHVQLRPGHYDLLYFREVVATKAATAIAQPKVRHEQPLTFPEPLCVSPGTGSAWSVSNAASRPQKSRLPTLGSEDFGEFEIVDAHRPCQGCCSSIQWRDKGGCLSSPFL